jgi:glutamine cyclotransferase
MRGKALALAALSLILLAGSAAPPPLSVCSYEVVQTFPHDERAFTEGLLYAGGQIYESTGIVGASTIRRVRLADGRVVKSIAVPPPYFGEGLAKWRNELVSLTWREGKGFRWDAASLRRKGEFAYAGEGWGLTASGSQLILSDGTPVLRFLDPATMKVARTLTVTAWGRPVPNLNELEWVGGEIYANVWHSDLILRIDPASGVVRSLIDLAGLRDRSGAKDPEAVLNGIAYDAAQDRLFVTGKYWSKLFQIRPRDCRPRP